MGKTPYRKVTTHTHTVTRKRALTFTDFGHQTVVLPVDKGHSGSPGPEVDDKPRKSQRRWYQERGSKNVMGDKKLFDEDFNLLLSRRKLRTALYTSGRGTDASTSPCTGRAPGVTRPSF